jgi:hypothetical protein
VSSKGGTYHSHQSAVFILYLPAGLVLACFMCGPYLWLLGCDTQPVPILSLMDLDLNKSRCPEQLEEPFAGVDGHAADDVTPFLLFGVFSV